MSVHLTQEEQAFVRELRVIRASNELPVGVDPFVLVNRIIDHLGSSDPELRDALGYRVLSRLIYRQKMLSVDQLRLVSKRVVAEDMWLSGIEEQNTNSVLLRSFSSLLVVLLLVVDAEDSFYQEEEWERVFQTLEQYCERELDFRGYIPGAGWAHSVAHAADVVLAFGKHPRTTKLHAARLLSMVQVLIGNATAVFVAEEDERLAKAVLSLVEAGCLTHADVRVWLEAVISEREDSVESMTVRTNWKHLVRSLYFLRQEAAYLEVEKRFSPWK